MDVDTGTNGAAPRRRTTAAAPPVGCRFVEAADLWVLSDDDEPDGGDLLVLSDADDRDLEEAGLRVLSDEAGDASAGVALARLLDRGKPSLAEATALAAVFLEAVADMHDAGRVHGALDSGAARLDNQANVRLDAPRPGAPQSRSGVPHRGEGAVRNAGSKRKGQIASSGGRHGDARRADVRAAAAVVAEIARSAGRPARPLTGAEERMAARLASAADPRSLVRRGARRAAHGLDQALGSAERRRAARHGLVTLIAAVAAADTGSASARDGGFAIADGTNGAPGAVGFAGVNGAPYAGSGGPTAVAAPARRLPPPARRPPIWPRVWKGVVAAVVVAMVLGLELRFFGARVQRNVHVLMSGNVPVAAAGPRRPAALPVLGPVAAPPVTHLEVRPLDGCRPESVCNAVVQVTVTPQDQPLDVAWAFELVDRCRPGREPRPGGVLQVPPGRDRAVQTVTMPLPAGPSLALIPVTSSPVVVAGTPMRLSPDSVPC